MKTAKTWRSRKTGENLLNIFEKFQDICVFDTETTGLKSLEGDTIIQISAIKLNISDMAEKERLNLYINPERPLPAKITEITGITDELLADKPTESEAFSAIYAFFGDSPVIGAYNTPFDKKFMEQLYERQGKVFLPNAECDVLEMSRDLVPKSEVENYKLGTIAHYYGVDDGITYHNSMDDVTATVRLLKVFKEEYKEKFNLTASAILVSPNVKSIRFWEGFRGFSRLYINTDAGTYYYDIRSKTWGGKSDNAYELEEVDMEALKARAFAFAGVSSEQEFAKFRA